MSVQFGKCNFDGKASGSQGTRSGASCTRPLRTRWRRLHLQGQHWNHLSSISYDQGIATENSSRMSRHQAQSSPGMGDSTTVRTSSASCKESPSRRSD